jgi:hypothetical protein
MKTTIEVAGHQIVIEEMEGTVMVSAMKDGETVEEFSLSAEGESSEGEEVQDEDDMKTFGDYGQEEEEDFESEEGQDEVQDEVQDEEESQDEEEEEDEKSSALESFQSFINKKRK